MNVLEIPLYDQGMDAAVRHVMETCSGKGEMENRCISATGAHGLIISKKDREFAEILRGFHMNLPDGRPGAVVGRLKGAKKMEQCTGPEFFRHIMETSAHTKVKHYFCGGKEGVAEDLKIACEQKFGNRNVVGCYSPPFRKMTEEELEVLGEKINRSGADIVWIGLSTPKQEYFAHTLSSFIRVHFIVTVGAAFDFHSGKLRKAPRFIQNMGLEWLFRLILEPRRLWKRYIEIVPKFMYYSTIELLTNKK
jgi:N-acetylglucosaminyldiphosphoundecaprenol N-acetyl-beta-D-mannosaminyltransferase